MKIQIFKQQDFTEVYVLYIPKVIALIKSIQGAKYSTIPVKKWTIPSSQFENLVALLTFHAVEIENVFEQKVLDETSNKENRDYNSVQISIDDHDFIVKLPIPKHLFDHLFDTPKKITFENFTINNEYFTTFFKFCFYKNLKINLI